MDPQQQINGFGSLPQRRGEFAKGFAKLSVLVPAIACVMAVFIVQDKGAVKDGMFFSIYGTGRLMLSFIIGKAMQKICYCCEEMRHRRTRYNGSLKKVLGSTFAFSSGDSFFCFVTVFLLVLSHVLQLGCTTFSHVDNQFWILCLNSCWVALLSFAVGCREPSILEVSRINERENKNVADGLAWGYYFAYLKVVLPQLDEQIGKSEQYRHEILKKLYILIPKNGYIFPTIPEADSRVTGAEKLRFTINRAGTPRTYTFTVHRIELASQTQPCYLVLEYCTTLMTLYEMNTEAGLSREQRDEQVVLFIRKLMEILDECPQYRNKYEFVPFSGERDTIAKVLEQKIKESRVAMPS